MEEIQFLQVCFAMWKQCRIYVLTPNDKKETISRLIFVLSDSAVTKYVTKYPRMNQVKLVDNGLWKILQISQILLGSFLNILSHILHSETVSLIPFIKICKI